MAKQDMMSFQGESRSMQEWARQIGVRGGAGMLLVLALYAAFWNITP